MEQHEYLTIKEVAARLRVHPLTIRRKIKSGELGANLIGDQYRISIDDFEAYRRKTRTIPEEEKDYRMGAKPAA